MHIYYDHNALKQKKSFRGSKWYLFLCSVASPPKRLNLYANIMIFFNLSNNNGKRN